jgi:hypothetical protein
MFGLTNFDLEIFGSKFVILKAFFPALFSCNIHGLDNSILLEYYNQKRGMPSIFCVSDAGIIWIPSAISATPP